MYKKSQGDSCTRIFVSYFISSFIFVYVHFLFLFFLSFLALVNTDQVNH
jgi:hypothetical protein